MKYHFKFFILFGVVSMFFPTYIYANSLQHFLDNLKTLNVRFAQIEEGKNHKGKVIYGDLIVKVPDRFIWRSEDKQQQDIVADGKKIWIYEKDLAQVSVYSQAETLPNTPAVLISSPQKFKQNFIIKEQRDKDEGIWYGLSPKQQNSFYDYIEVYVSHQKITKLIISNRISDAVTHIDLYYSEGSLNGEISNDTFKFNVPDGVDLLQ
jgi:chaperone LolA